jgi:hypothetical protein
MYLFIDFVSSAVLLRTLESQVRVLHLVPGLLELLDAYFRLLKYFASILCYHNGWFERCLITALITLFHPDVNDTSMNDHAQENKNKKNIITVNMSIEYLLDCSVMLRLVPTRWHQRHAEVVEKPYRPNCGLCNFTQWLTCSFKCTRMRKWKQGAGAVKLRDSFNFSTQGADNYLSIYIKANLA